MTEFYQVIENPFGPGWAVVNEMGIIVRTNPRKDLMMRYARDPEWRWHLAEEAVRAERQWESRNR